VRSPDASTPNRAQPSKQPSKQLAVFAYADLRRGLRAIRRPDAGPTGGAEQGRAGRADGVQRDGGQGLSGAAEMERAGRVPRQAQWHAGVRRSTATASGPMLSPGMTVIWCFSLVMGRP